MTVGGAVLLAGLVLVPVVLLRAGHGFRTLSPLGRRMFWGGVLGQICGATATLVALLVPPVAWAPEGWRVLAIHWSLLAATLLGTVAGLVAGRARETISPRASPTPRPGSRHR